MKKELIIILIVSIALIVLAMTFLLPKKLDTNMKEEVIKILKEISEKYGIEIAANVEKIFRLETANFTSAQFLGTYSAGMMKFGANFPYGWYTLNDVFWNANPQFKPIGFKSFNENVGLGGEGGGKKEFLVFPNLKASMFTVAAFLQHYNNNAGRWYSKDELRQSNYNNKLAEMSTKYV